MAVEVVHEPDQWPSYPVENCCLCRKPTRFWYGTGPSNVALCPPCAAKADPRSLPTKRQWLLREGSEPKATTEGLGAEPAEPGAAERHAPNNRSTPGSAPTGEALTDEQEREAFASAMAPRGYKCRWSSLDGWDNTNVFHAWNGWSAARAALATHPSAPVAPAESPEHDHEKFDAIAADRYKVVPTKSGFWGYAVVVGDSAAEVYKGHKRDCDLVARRMAGAFLDGAFLASRPPAVQPVAPAGWQPIETAPKDGTLFLCWVSAVQHGESDEGQQYQVDVSQADFCQWQAFEEAPDGGWFEPCCGQISDQQAVTHWMPLPAAPSAPTEALAWKHPAPHASVPLAPRVQNKESDRG